MNLPKYSICDRGDASPTAYKRCAAESGGISETITFQHYSCEVDLLYLLSSFLIWYWEPWLVVTTGVDYTKWSKSAKFRQSDISPILQNVI